MSKVTQALIRCPHCHSASGYNVWVSANVTVSPHLKEEVLSGSLFWKECPKCNQGFSASHDLLYHDMEKRFCVWLKYENAAGEIELEPGADRADRVFTEHQLRIAFVRDGLIEKIKIDRDGYDDIFIEGLKVFHGAKFNIDLVSPFYYDRTENREDRPTLVFVHKPKGLEPIEDTVDLIEGRSAVEPFVSKIRAALKSEWAPWMWVSRATVLMTFEEVGLVSPVERAVTVEDKPESLVEKAETLVTMASSVAISSLTSAEQQLELPEAITDDIENWDFFVTVAGVFAALHALAQTVSDGTFETIGTTVFQKLNEWNPQGSGAFADCQHFVENSLKSGSAEQIEITTGDAIGMWLLCNLYGRFPTMEESAPARPLGGFLLDVFLTGGLKQISYVEIVMNKAQAIAHIVHQGLASEVTASSIHFANVNSAKNVWWLDIPLAKLAIVSGPRIGLLLYEQRCDRLHYLEVPKSYLKDNLNRLVVRSSKGCIGLELSTEPHKLFRDVRPTGGCVNFAQFLKPPA